MSKWRECVGDECHKVSMIEIGAVKELEEKLAAASEERDNSIIALTARRQENVRLRKALEQIAKLYYSSGDEAHQEIAREALEGEK